MPGLTRNKEQLGLRQAGEGKKERKQLSGLMGRSFPNTGLNFFSADHPQTLNPKPTCHVSIGAEN
jgi:hypothetical protein